MNKPAELKLDTVPVWINGKPLTPAGRAGDVFNPATGQVIRRVPFCDASIIDAAVKAAGAALPEWRDTPVLRRARVMQEFLFLLKKNQKNLAAIVSEEHGKTLPDAMGSVQRGIEVVEFACGIPQLLKGEFSENVGTQVDTPSLKPPLSRCGMPQANSITSRPRVTSPSASDSTLPCSAVMIAAIRSLCWFTSSR